ncbi:MAG TPA: hypothetical protein VFS21_15680 [Roseiflexaceae bacterium]|nr:hypothetical protein [Roseiflexaceae bacterium]
MPTVRKLAADEVKTLERRPGQRAEVAARYDEFLRDFQLGDYGNVDLEPHENRITERNRLRAAAKRKGVALRMLRTPVEGDSLRFQVIPLANSA